MIVIEIILVQQICLLENKEKTMLKLHKMADWAGVHKDKFSADVQGYCKFAQLAKSCITKTPWKQDVAEFIKNDSLSCLVAIIQR